MHDRTALQNDLESALRRHTSGEVRFDPTTRKLYSTDASIYQVEPLGVVIPRTLADLQSTVQITLERNISLVPRGGGTSLSGQSIGPGLVVDCSKYLNQILEIDLIGRRARVQPGVILDQLNRTLLPHNLWFGPDVATASRANLGGMIGNNSAGARSIVYGKTADHVRTMRVILSDGQCYQFGPLSMVEWQRKADGRGLEAQAYAATAAVVRRDAAEIRQRFPNILRRVSGYNLEGVLSSLEGGATASLLPLLVGSEGTLGFVTEAEINLVPRPRHRGLLVPHFSSLRAALDTLQDCLAIGPSAVELLDSMLIRLAADNLALRGVMRQIQGRPAALLMVEISSDDEREVRSRLEGLQAKLAGVPGLTATPLALDAATRDSLWNLRSAAVPLLYGMKGDRKTVTFVEDTAVSPHRLPEFADRFREVLHKHGTDGAFYGHASVGCLHIRPVLNLKQEADVRRMRQIMEDITDLVLAFGGSLSGEHGDGLVRSEWNRKMYGPVVYEAFREIKKALDPKNLFNPGKVVDAPAMTENLRQGPGYKTIELPTVFDYSKQEGVFGSIELCNGSGVCRKLQGGAMCPSFRATHDEADSTRGRANALRIALQDGIASQSDAPLAQRWVYDVMDLCLMCKACKAECPSNVDIAKLKAEYLQAYYRENRRPLGHRLMARIHHINQVGALLPGVTNWVNNRSSVRWLLERVAGIDRRRSLPVFHRNHLRSWIKRRPAPVKNAPRVILLDDCFTSYNEPAIGQAAVRVLEAAGYSVELAGVCCGRSMISKGFLDDAQALARTGVRHLAARVADGTPILGLEPSCLLTLADEWPELVLSPEAAAVAAAARLADEWIAERVAAGLRLPLRECTDTVVFHGHCHQKALCGIQGSAAALRLVPGLNVHVLDTGCCGMAGSFGYETDHYDLSVQIANLDLLPQLLAAPNATVAATGTSCRHQIKDLAGRKALHPMELIANALA